MSDAGQVLGQIISDRAAASSLVHVEQDDCCSARLRRALPKVGTARAWDCPKCGAEWELSSLCGVQAWRPVIWFKLL